MTHFEIAHGGMSDVFTVSMTERQLALFARVALHLNGQPQQLTTEELLAVKNLGACASDAVNEQPRGITLIHGFCL